MSTHGEGYFPAGLSELTSDTLSVREYFAAHAPDEPQAWFEPTMPEPRPVGVYRCSGTHAHKDDCEAYYCSRVNDKETIAWDARYHRERPVQWPWAWADAILAAKSPQ